METSTTPADAAVPNVEGHGPAAGLPARHGPPSNGAVPPRAHLQSALTLGLALLILAVGWAGVAEFPWWDALGVEPQPWWHLGPLAVMAAALLMRIRRPVTALVLGLCCVLLDLSIGMNLGILLCLSDLVYSLGIRAPRRTVRIVAATFAAGTLGTTALLLTVGVEPRSSVSLALGMAAVLLMPLWWAIEVRRGFPLWQEADARGQLEAERHAALLRSQTRARREAVEEERRRMARELHDVVSSQVSAIALTSGAVLNTGPDSERDRTALQTIRGTSVEALEQLREMVQLLRGGDDGGPHPSSEDELLDSSTWQDVLERASSHGLDISVHGEPPAGLAPAVHHVLLRVLQESLTNALKHGDGSAEVAVSRRRRRTRLSVTSRMRSSQESAETSEESHRTPHGSGLGAGSGLLTMRERVQHAGGRFRAGPHPEDPSCWRVEAELPMKESAA